MDSLISINLIMLLKTAIINKDNLGIFNKNYKFMKTNRKGGNSINTNLFLLNLNDDSLSYFVYHKFYTNAHF